MINSPENDLVNFKACYSTPRVRCAVALAEYLKVSISAIQEEKYPNIEQDGYFAFRVMDDCGCMLSDEVYYVANAENKSLADGASEQEKENLIGKYLDGINVSEENHYFSDWIDWDEFREHLYDNFEDYFEDEKHEFVKVDNFTHVWLDKGYSYQIYTNEE